MGRGRNFFETATSLSDIATSLLVDQTNHAASPWTAEFSYADMADDVADAIRTAFGAGEKVIVIGHSMGGKTAMQLALQHPELVHALVVVDISPVPRPDAGVFPDLLGSLLELDLNAIRSRTDADRLLRDKIPDERTRAFLLQSLIRGDGGFCWEPNLPLLHASLQTIMGFAPPVGASFNGPVLWIAGGNSDYVRPGDLPRMQELFPDVYPVVVDDASHWVHADKPEQFQALLREFITSDC
ncbi:alpha/beta fold hydrolase [Leucobacter sp. OH1287]|nr:alpha/beta fold hydrolase [Leucobacter sp. OH1287]